MITTGVLLGVLAGILLVVSPLIADSYFSRHPPKPLTSEEISISTSVSAAGEEDLLRANEEATRLLNATTMYLCTGVFVG